MATIESQDIIREVIDHRGFYPGDEDNPNGPVVRVTEYVNGWGTVAWGIVYRSEAERFGMLGKYQHETEYVNTPRVIWELPRERWHEPAGTRQS